MAGFALPDATWRDPALLLAFAPPEDFLADAAWLAVAFLPATFFFAALFAVAGVADAFFPTTFLAAGCVLAAVALADFLAADFLAPDFLADATFLAAPRGGDAAFLDVFPAAGEVRFFGLTASSVLNSKVGLWRKSVGNATIYVKLGQAKTAALGGTHRCFATLRWLPNGPPAVTLCVEP
ncbi:MAG: hypothetical protein D6753_16330 [Planctomycetota bacterium]|nr:MAG: hypothetical protein D6753_16330 [Planctomycetota bacterium]